MHGGQGTGGEILGDAWLFDVASRRWQPAMINNMRRPEKMLGCRSERPCLTCTSVVVEHSRAGVSASSGHQPAPMDGTSTADRHIAGAEPSGRHDSCLVRHCTFSDYVINCVSVTSHTFTTNNHMRYIYPRNRPMRPWSHTGHVIHKNRGDHSTRVHLKVT